MQSSIRMDRNVPMEMRDGIILRADIFRPYDAQKLSAVLFRTPYDKALTGNSDFLNVIEAAFAGYVVIIQDVRGRFASEGEWKRESMLTVEGPDGYIDISSSNFLMFDRNMNTGNPIGEDAHGVPATQTVSHQSGYASYMDLPVIPRKSVR